MAMPASGAINMGGTASPVSIAQELGLGLTATISMNDAAIRTLAAVGGSGTAWSMSSLYGKANRVAAAATISGNTQNYTLNTAKAPGYVAGKTDMVLTINGGVVVGSASEGSYALTVDTSWAGGDTVRIDNNGTITGKGGVGGGGSGGGSKGSAGVSGTAGGYGLYIGRATSINNTGELSGGGGGGGGGGTNGTTNDPAPAAGPGGNGAGAGGSGVYGATVGSQGGGNGGSRGAAGQAGVLSGNGFGVGGGAGYYIIGSANVTWVATGTRIGNAG